jgi:hypothetical protein
MIVRLPDRLGPRIRIALRTSSSGATGALNKPDGYGDLQLDGQVASAHRLVYEWIRRVRRTRSPC